MTAYVPREIASLVKRALKEMPVVVVTGMRQTGKSTFLRSEPGLRGRRYFNFDDFAHLAAAKEDPENFAASDEPITIDEAHKCPELFAAIKVQVDRRRRPGQFLLSGSANFLLLPTVSETLAGRAVYFTLRPFTRREKGGSIKRKPFLQKFLASPKLKGTVEAPGISSEEVLTGGMPSVLLEEVKDRWFWFKGYEQTYLDRDVMELSRIGDVFAFRNLLRLAAVRTGQILNPSQLGRDAKLSQTTTLKYLSLMEASFLFNRLSPYLRNRSSRLIKSPKLYWTDSGLACHLAGISDFRPGFEETLKGAMLETYVAQNLLGTLEARWPGAELFFWNVQGRREVDFVVEAGGRCLALEVKAGSRWTDGDLSGLKAFLASTPCCEAAILAYNGAEPASLGGRLWALPIDLILS